MNESLLIFQLSYLALNSRAHVFNGLFNHQTDKRTQVAGQQVQINSGIGNYRASLTNFTIWRDFFKFRRLKVRAATHDLCDTNVYDGHWLIKKCSS